MLFVRRERGDVAEELAAVLAANGPEQRSRQGRGGSTHAGGVEPATARSSNISTARHGVSGIGIREPGIPGLGSPCSRAARSELDAVAARRDGALGLHSARTQARPSGTHQADRRTVHSAVRYTAPRRAVYSIMKTLLSSHVARVVQSAWQFARHVRGRVRGNVLGKRVTWQAARLSGPE